MRTSSGATQLCSGCGGRDFSDASTSLHEKLPLLGLDLHEDRKYGFCMAVPVWGSVIHTK